MGGRDPEDDERLFWADLLMDSRSLSCGGGASGRTKRDASGSLRGGGLPTLSASFPSTWRRPFGVSTRREASSLEMSSARNRNGSVTVERVFPGTPSMLARTFTRIGPSISRRRYFCSRGPSPRLSSCSSAQAFRRSATVINCLASARATRRAEAVSLRASLGTPFALMAISGPRMGTRATRREWLELTPRQAATGPAPRSGRSRRGRGGARARSRTARSCPCPGPAPR